MPKPPFRTSSGDIGCPRCNTPLKKGEAPFYIRGEKVGIFDAIVCPICNYSALSENGYDEAISKAKRLGMVGLKEEIPDITPLELIINQSKIAKNVQKIMFEDESIESTTWFVEDVFVFPQPLTISHFTKKSLSRTR